MPNTNTTALDSHIADLRSAARVWVTTPLEEKWRLLQDLHLATAEVADEWVRLSCEAKGIALGSPAAGEEWMSGPYALHTNAAALARTVEQLETGINPLDRVRVRTLHNGRVALRAFPADSRDRVLMGYTGYVWLRPGITLDQAKAGVARRLRETNLPGQVGLVLGAGNVNSIAPLDGLTKLYQDNAVVLIKLNPVNAYLEPVFNRAFASFVERGFMRITSGGADIGSYLVSHPEMDSVHITGSSASYDAVVFGPGEEGARRKEAREPLLSKPITSELGGVGPVVVVPGRWKESTLRLQAQNVATQRLHNSGFNCVATQIAVLPQTWPQAGRFVDYVRQAVRDAPYRPAYYPSAADRQRGAVEAHPEAELLGGDPDVPRTLLTDLHPTWMNPPSVPSISVRFWASLISRAPRRRSSWTMPFSSATTVSSATWALASSPRRGRSTNWDRRSTRRSPGCATARWRSIAGSAPSSPCPAVPGEPSRVTMPTTWAAAPASCTTRSCSTRTMSSAWWVGARSNLGRSLLGS
jgi:hypothetical protein